MSRVLTVKNAHLWVWLVVKDRLANSWRIFASRANKWGRIYGIRNIQERSCTICCCWSISKSCPTLCDPMDWCKAVFIVLQYISEFAEIHVHWVGDAMQPSYPLLSPSLTLSLSQYKCLFQWIRYLYQVTKVSDLHLQHQPFQWTFSWFPLGLTGLISLLSKGLSRVFSITTFKSVNSPAFSLLYGPTLTSVHDYWKNHSIDYMDLHQQSDVSAFYMLSSFVIAYLPRRSNF